MNRLRPTALPALLAAVVVLSGCAGTADPAAGDDARITVANFRAPVSDWALESDDAFILSIAGCLETLVRYDQDAQTLEPMLASSWEQVDDTTWDFTLRDDVRFQDGEELTPDAVASALTHVLEADAPARIFTPELIAGVSAVDDATVRVETTSADPLLPYRLAGVNTGILSPAAYTADGIDPFGTCTGPFAPVSEESGQSLTVDRNDDYWGGDVALAGGEIRFLADGQTRATQVQTGEADIAMSIPAASLEALQADDAITLEESVSPRTATLYLNNSRAPFDDVELRRAVTAALDVTELAETVYEGAAQPATGPFAPTEAWADPDRGVAEVDLEEAARLVEESGYVQDQPLQVIAIVERAEFAGVGAVIQEQLAKIGLEVEVVEKEYAAAEPDVLAGDYDMLLSQRNRMVDIADPGGFLQADYTCDGSYNLTHFCDEEYDALVAQALAEPDAEARFALYRQAGDILADQAANVWLVNEQAIDGVSADVRGYDQDPLTRYVLTQDLALAG